MGCWIKRLIVIKNNSAVTDVISLILVIIIMVSTISVVLVWGIPEINKNKSNNRAENVLAQFSLIGDLLIEGVVGQGYNSSKNVRFSADGGTVTVSTSETRFVFYYSLKEGFDFNVSGFFDETEDAFEFYNYDSVAKVLDINYINTGNSDTRGAPPGQSTVNTNFPLSDTVRIDIIDTGDIIGLIWLFDIGSITYTDRSQTFYKASIETGAVISNSYIQNTPNFIFENSLLYLNLIQIKNTDITSVSWGGIDQTPKSVTLDLQKINQKSNLINLNIKNKETYIREDKVKIKNNFKISIYNSNEESENAWNNYLEYFLNLNMYDSGDAKDTFYFIVDPNLSFTFIQSICDVNLEVT